MHVEFEIPGLKDLQKMTETFLKPLKGFINEAVDDNKDNSALKVARIAASFFALAGSGLYLGCAIAFQSASSALAATGLFMFAIAVLPCEHKASTIARLAQDLFSFCFRFIPAERRDPIHVMNTGIPFAEAERNVGEERVGVAAHSTVAPMQSRSAAPKIVELD